MLQQRVTWLNLQAVATVAAPTGAGGAGEVRWWRLVNWEKWRM